MEFIGTLCERARGEPFFGVLGLDHLERAKPQPELEGESFFVDGRKEFADPRDGTFSVETTRDCVGVGLLSREGVGVKEFVEDGGEEESFLKGKGRRERDLGFDQ